MTFSSFSLEIEGVFIENLRRNQLRRKLARKARLPDGFHEIGFDLVLTSSNHRCGSDRFGIGESIEQHLQTEEVVTMAVGDVNGDEICATLDDPIHQFSGLLLRQKRIDKNSVALTINERDGIGDPGEIFLARRDALRGAPTSPGQQLPF